MSLFEKKNISAHTTQVPYKCGRPLLFWQQLLLPPFALHGEGATFCCKRFIMVRGVSQQSLSSTRTFEHTGCWLCAQRVWQHAQLAMLPAVVVQCEHHGACKNTTQQELSAITTAYPLGGAYTFGVMCDPSAIGLRYLAVYLTHRCPSNHLLWLGG
jgi:hypothetical protein